MLMKHKNYKYFAPTALDTANPFGIGMVGYRAFEPMSWVDAFVNAAMILSGMGPVSSLQTDAGKIFAGCYALFSGLAFLTSIGIVFAPAFHRFLHKFHVEEAKRDAKLPDKP
ncbi:MAG: hypothetical protein ABSC01_14675 [Verrucomicrobiota bacterium]